MNKDIGFLGSLVAGGSAGFSVDVALFPLDTIKTRIQSDIGFKAAGGLRNIYNGLGPAALGSAPNAAVFFCTYEYTKKIIYANFSDQYEFCNHATAASIGEIAACIIRVPTEVLKQRRQMRPNSSSLDILKSCLREEGALGLYRGYWSTVAREIPFSFIQYPLWEFLKRQIASKEEVKSWESALSGAVAGGLAAGVTTPLDVAKTRIMLARKGTTEAEGKVATVLAQVYAKTGVRGLYAGVVPRSLWMSLGGGIYFGVYEFICLAFS